MRNLLAGLAIPTVLATCASAQQPPKPPKPPVPAVALATAALAGQSVAVLPLTLVVSDPRIPGTSGPEARRVLLRWADSLLGEVLAERASEVTWLLPDALRRTAARAPGLLPSPDQMGQSVLRSHQLKEVPDPLRSSLRQLLALSGGARFALVPAALYLDSAPADSLRIQLAAVLVDGRLGRILWRTLAPGQGATAEQAYRAALATMLPGDPSAP
jgi:hypothetical protein